MREPEQSTEAAEASPTDAKPESSSQELVDLLRRERASFLNYKRRMEQERAEDRERAHAALLTRLLPLLDELDRALTQLPRELEGNSWAQGVALIHRHLQVTLRELGIDRVGVEGEVFDPERHEALLYDGPPDATDRRVGTVIRPGYRMGERLLRPAQVFVVGGANTSTAPNENAERSAARSENQLAMLEESSGETKAEKRTRRRRKVDESSEEKTSGE